MVVVLVGAIAALIGFVQHAYWSDVTFERTLELLPLGRVTLRRENEGAVMAIRADTMSAALFGLGYAHAYDRAVQMVMLRAVVQGRVSELLANSPKANNIDVAMRTFGIYQRARETEALLASQRRAQHASLHTYVDGINRAFRDSYRPIEFWAVQLDPEPWTIADSIATLNVMCLLDLADVQGVVELFVVQALREGVSERLLTSVFPHVAALDGETRDAIRELVLERPFLPEVLHFLSSVAPAKGLGSNSWAVAPSRSASGKVQLVNDPHLQTSRLPAIWYEAKVVIADSNHAVFGCTMPGVPAVVMGRNKDVAFGFTYGFADQMDFVVERVSADGKYEREDGRQEPLVRRVEEIKRKGEAPLFAQVVSTSAGPLEIKPLTGTDKQAVSNAQVPGGVYLARATAFDQGGLLRTLSAVAMMLQPTIKTVDDVREAFGPVILSSNIIAGDSKGDILYQQTGQVRKRRWNGFVPWLGWRGEPYDGELDWRTYTTVKNPASGFLTTANNDVRLDMLGADATATPIVNAHMGDHRVARISELLPETAKHDEASMLALLADTRVNFAPAFLDVLRDTLSARTDNVTRILREWDVRAEVDSLGCTIFHRVYDALHTQLTGAALGADAWRHIRYDTPLFVDFSQHWDRALLREDLLFNATHTREREFARVANAVLDSLATAEILPWGIEKQYVMKNIFFADANLPSWLGFDSSPVPAPGASGTVVQSASFRTHGRDSNWQQSWRFWTDLAAPVALTTMPGGPSGNRFSALYTSNTQAWSDRKYKRVDLK